MSCSSDAVNTIFEERSDFIVIGLTGRTGSGCTTVSKILSQNNFNKLALKTPKDCDFTENEQRKYRLVYNYAKCNWTPFRVIEMSTVLASFVFQEGYSPIKKFINEQKNIEIHRKDKLLSELETLSPSINKISEDFKNYIGENGRLKKNSAEIKIAELKLLSQISKETIRFKEVLKKYTLTQQINIKGDNQECIAQAYTYFFQQFGNNVRSSGNPFNSSFSGKNMFDLAQRANDFIKAIREVQRLKKESTLICIDALRNPYEATYFQDRYSAFYLIAIDTEDEERGRRLAGMNKNQILSLDAMEYPNKLTDEKTFNQQNIAACLEIADIHIYNPKTSIKENYYLTKQLIMYVMLMKHPGLVTPSHIERCMQIAYNAKLNSGCLSRQVGAVITDNNFSIKAIGWNDVPSGQVSCNLRDVNSLCVNRDYNSHSKFEIENNEFSDKIHNLRSKINYSRLKGRLYPYCFKDIHDKKNQVHTRSLHAEENAFLQIVKYGGIGIKEGALFTTASPCELCSKKAYQLGIKEIYYIDPYPGISKDHILKFGDNNLKMKLFYGAIGSAYTKLYSQRLSIKDELKMLNEE
ncbi:dCMP deaminase [Sporosalibacterium faouarense]|uniref:dCMP deaminase n=1 Tax=Sporosalibacterium faouarense TaxID=516123 RepID=UPI00192C055C|nr:dCMP deaminase [Sporosalibacterium faouarense]